MNRRGFFGLLAGAVAAGAALAKGKTQNTRWVARDAVWVFRSYPQHRDTWFSDGSNHVAVLKNGELHLHFVEWSRVRDGEPQMAVRGPGGKWAYYSEKPEESPLAHRLRQPESA